MKFFSWILILIITVVGCKKDNSLPDEGDFAFLGGEIINANTDYVVIYKSDKALDTIKLDGNNRFVHKIKNLTAGLYTYRHGGEIQMVLLEPNDSIMFRLNTLEFDESLIYTGEGAKKNNYLVNEFLQNEVEEKKIYKYCQLNSETYAKQVDSLKAYKLEKLKSFQEKYKTSALFDKIAQANIEYSYYFNKEIYPFVHYGKNKGDILETLPENFYAYRKDINYNDDFLKDYFSYNTFLKSNFSNLALNMHYNGHSNDSIFNRNNVCYNLDRLHLIDSLVTNSKIKENLLYTFTISHLTKNKNIDTSNAVLKYYTKISKSEDGVNMVTNYANSLHNLKAGNSIPEVKLISYKNAELVINSIINSPTVVSFWSYTFYNHFKESHHKIKELQAKYPEVKFIVINIDNYGIETSTKALERNLFSLQNEYIFKNPEASIETLAVRPVTKVIIIDKNQKIIDNNTNIFAKHFEEQLLGLINR